MDPVQTSLIPVVHGHQLLTIKEAAAEVGVDAKMLKARLSDPDGPRTIPWGNELRIPRFELPLWEERLMAKDGKRIETFMSRPQVRTSSRRRPAIIAAIKD